MTLAYKQNIHIPPCDHCLAIMPALLPDNGHACLTGVVACLTLQPKTCVARLVLTQILQFQNALLYKVIPCLARVNLVQST